MPDEVKPEEQVLTVTPAALEVIRKIKAERGFQNHALRVFVQGGGCSGLQYGMGFDDNPRESDTVVDYGDVQVIIDRISLAYMVGAQIDYVESLMGGGFAIHNPNAVSSCGCGQSFSTGSSAGGGSGCSGCG